MRFVVPLPALLGLALALGAVEAGSAPAALVLAALAVVLIAVAILLWWADAPVRLRPDTIAPAPEGVERNGPPGFRRRPVHRQEPAL